MTTEKADDGGVRFSYDLDAVRALYDDHCQTDLLPEARALDDADRLGLVIAGKADVVPRDLGLKDLRPRGERPQRPRGRAAGLARRRRGDARRGLGAHVLQAVAVGAS